MRRDRIGALGVSTSSLNNAANCPLEQHWQSPRPSPANGKGCEIVCAAGWVVRDPLLWSGRWCPVDWTGVRWMQEGEWTANTDREGERRPQSTGTGGLVALSGASTAQSGSFKWTRTPNPSLPPLCLCLVSLRSKSNVGRPTSAALIANRYRWSCVGSHASSQKCDLAFRSGVTDHSLQPRINP